MRCLRAWMGAAGELARYQRTGRNHCNRIKERVRESSSVAEELVG